MNKKKLIILFITLIVLLLTVGIAYAYFSASYIENTQEEMIVSGDIVLRIDDVNIVTNENFIPGDEIEKMFTVTNTSDKNTTYDLWFSDVINTFYTSGEIIYKIYSDDGGINITSDYNSVPTSDKKIYTWSIDANTTHTYTLKIIYKDITTGSGNSIYNMGSSFSAKIKINEETSIARMTVGQTFNKKIKQLANPDATINYTSFSDTNITGFQRTNELDTSKEYINIAYTDYEPIYAWYDNGIIYYYCAQEKIYILDGDEMLYKFNGITEFTWPSDWDTSFLKSTSRVFKYMENCTKMDLRSMNTSSVNYMDDMFTHCKNLVDLDVSSFDTSNVKEMIGMFSYLSSIETLDLSNFYTPSLRYISSDQNYNSSDGQHCGAIFSNMDKLVTLKIPNFDFSSVANFVHMFNYDGKLKNIIINKFDTSSGTNMAAMFNGCKELENIDFSNFNTSNVENMAQMFKGMNGIKRLDLSGFDTSNVTNMRGMFEDNTSLEYLDISTFDTSKVTDMAFMFSESNISSLDLKKFDTSMVENMSYMFYKSKVSSLDLSSFDTSKVTNMYGMFGNSTNLQNLNISSFNTSNVTNMAAMFYKTKLTSLDLSHFDTSKVESMIEMFSGMQQLTSLNISNFNTSNVKYMSYMFYEINVSTLDLSSFDTSKVTSMGYFFNNCYNLVTIYVSDKWNTLGVISSEYMFTNDTKIKGGNGTTYDSTHTNVSYAHVDVAGDPGYLTLKV